MTTFALRTTAKVPRISGAVGVSGDVAFSVVPSWVPTTAWQWTSVPTSTWADYMKTDGTGIAPAITAADPGPERTYTGQWSTSGPAYSRARHEIYWFGGGHANSTINALSRWNLTESPTVSLVSAPTSEANRNAYLLAEDWRTTVYQADGKPSSPHSYYNNLYSDSTDEFISFGVAALATGYPTASGGTVSFPDIAAFRRSSGTWRAADFYADVTFTKSITYRGPRVESHDGAAIYYWDGDPQLPTTDVRKFVLATNTHSTLGASVIPFYSSQADTGLGYIGVIGSDSSTSGWQVSFVNTTTGATTAVTVSGDSLATGLACFDSDWSAARGYFVTVWINASALFGGAAVSTIVVATITPTGASTATASIKTMTGTAPALARGWHGLFYDPTFDACIMVTDHSAPLKVFKVN